MSELVDKHCAAIDFYTPENILDPVRAYFHALTGRGIDLDPATAANNPTKAERFYTAETNGLDKNWTMETSALVDRANVFCNPPYGTAIRAWVEKIGAEASAGCRLVALLPGQRFEQAYWQQSLFTPQLTALVAVRSRVSFLRPDGSVAKGNPYGSFLYVFNGDWPEVVKAFAPIGMCIEMGRIAQHVGEKSKWAK